MKKVIKLSLILLISIQMISQETEKNEALPYYEIPEYTSEYTIGSVTARMVDGLGFRYRWATEDLREEDLNFKPSVEARSTGETIDHILSLSRVIVNSTLKIPTDSKIKHPELTYLQKRQETLENFKTASDILMNATILSDYKIQFVFEGGSREYPFWNNLNGPIADAIWHCGQIASFRRSSGNPIDSKVQFLQGKIKD